MKRTNSSSTATPAPEIGSGHAPWIELSASALRQNVALFRDLLSRQESSSSSNRPPKLGAVVKSNAYGHGIEQMMGLLSPLVDILYVTTAREARTAREIESGAGLPRKRLVVLGATAPAEAVDLARLDVETVISGGELGEHVEALREVGLRLRAHVHVDTGLGREGYSSDALEAVSSELRAASDVLDVIGVCSHFANVEDVTEQAYSALQLDAFERSARSLCELLGRRLERHIAASAAAMVLPRARQDVVRAGISLYGLWPSSETRLSARVVLDEPTSLAPVLSWHCRPQMVKTIPAGSYVGYGCTWRAPRATRIAVLPVGYYDGYPRLVSGRAHALVEGARCPVVGRVMMNHIVIDVTGVPQCGPDSVVTLLGTGGSENLSADLLASWAQTINYEIVARLGPHLARVMVD